MASRLSLQEKLEEVIESRNVYFQPPESVKMTYPCIVYKLGSGNVKYASDIVYNFTKSYDVSYICKKPDIEFIDKMHGTFPMCKFNRHYVTNGLNHYVFTLYF